MLESLTIRHIALIDEASVLFHDGFQVLTGETGAGKSMVVDAVNLILGSRADRDLIRTGCSSASVEAVFSVSRENRKALEFLENEQIEYDGQTVTVYREISASGKNICRVCGVMLPVSRLRDLSSCLMDIHGQSDHQFLTNPDIHLSFLDQTGDAAHRELLERTQADCAAFLSSHRKYAKLVRKNEHSEERVRILQRDLEELSKVNLVPGEEEELHEEWKQLSRAVKESDTLRTINDLISGSEIGDSSLARIRAAAESMKKMSSENSQLEALGEKCSGLYYELEEISYQLSLLLSKAEADPFRLEKIESRLDLIHRLEKKYGTEAKDLPRLVSEKQTEYEELLNLDKEIASASKEHKQLLAQYRNTARELTSSRKKLAADFEQRIMKELGDLGMAHTVFRVEFKPNETGRPLMPTPEGDDRVEFMISPNPGEPLKPLARIASGGELSRLMLAIKSMEASHRGVDSMVFDEIDTGISGRMAQTVAEKMIAISRTHQVICVSHLPQLAAAADHQYLVRKGIEGERTRTFVSELTPEERIGEIGRMISGADGITEESNHYAAGMLRAAEDLKRQQAAGKRHKQAETERNEKKKCLQ